MFNFDFLTLVITALSNITLVIFVYYYGKKNVNQIFFVLLVLSLTFWGVNNFFSVHSDPEFTLFWIRIVMLFAIPQTYLLFLFIYTFPDKKITWNKWVFYSSIFITIVLMGLSLTPLIFESVVYNNQNIEPVKGLLMPVFGLYIIFFTIFSFFYLFKRFYRAEGLEKKQWKYIAAGLILTFSLMVFFNYLSVVFFKRTNFVRFGHLFHIPLILSFVYALIRYNLMNIKVIASELLSVLLSFFLLVKVLTSSTYTELVINVIVFVAVVIISILLVKSILREIKQVKKLKKITSALQEANARLTKLDEAKTEFLSITSHQLRTPLSAIKGYLSMLSDGDYGKMTKEQNDIVGVLLRNSERLIRLINIFLNISRIESGRLKILKTKQNINNIISDIIKSLEIEATEKNIKIEFKTKSDISTSCDSDKVTDVILNLIDNAIKYTPNGGKIVIEVKKMEKYVLVSVTDTGRGISYEELDELFNKFRRGKDINKVDTSGVGLGLYIAKKIIEGHSGNIWAESDGYGKGSTFKFTLPY